MWKFDFLLKPCFMHWRTAFYKEVANIPGVHKKNVKILPNNIENLLVNPLSLATWFMDDGGKGGLHGIIISVHSFTDDEIKKLIYTLEKNFS
jgi:hypothetical protein